MLCILICPYPILRISTESALWGKRGGGIGKWKGLKKLRLRHGKMIFTQQIGEVLYMSLLRSSFNFQLKIVLYAYTIAVGFLRGPTLLGFYHPERIRLVFKGVLTCFQVELEVFRLRRCPASAEQNSQSS